MSTTCSESSTRDSTVALDRDEIKENALFYIDGYDEEDLSDATVGVIIEKVIDRFEDADNYFCDVVYVTLLECIRYLMRKGWAEDGNEAKGILTGIIEKEGQVTEQVTYNVASDSSSETGWDKLYNYFLEHPDDICECLAPTYLNRFGMVAIGGTKQSKFNEANSDPDGRNVYDTNSVGIKYSSWREYRRRGQNYRSKFWRR